MKISNSTLCVSNDKFLEDIFGPSPDGNVVVCGFPGDPGKAPEHSWIARIHKPGFGWRETNNNYFSISTFLTARRRKEDVVSTPCFFIDDIILDPRAVHKGGKIEIAAVKLEPTWVNETSPNNAQVGYKFTTPIPGAVAGRLIDAMIERLTGEGSDPGMAGANRYGKLPQGTNGKPDRDGWRNRMRTYEPARTYTLEQICEAYGLEIEAIFNPPVVERPEADGDDETMERMLEWQYEQGRIQYESGNKIHLDCPWAHEHTNGDTTGTCLLRPGAMKDQQGWGFKCHHGHCAKRTLKDVMREWYEKDPQANPKLSPHEAFAGIELGDSAPEENLSVIDLMLPYEVNAEDIAGIRETKLLYYDMIPEGHMTVIAGSPGAGKTTIMEHVAAELSDALTVFYVNADISASDVPEAQHKALAGGYRLLCPDIKPGLSMGDVGKTLKDIARGDEPLHGFCFIIDTLKKLADVINKQEARGIYKMLRKLTARGATVICLAHTNKHKDRDDKPIFEGTGDLISDFDNVALLHAHHEGGAGQISSLYWKADGIDWGKSRAPVEHQSWEIDLDGPEGVRAVKRLECWQDTIQLAKDASDGAKLAQIATWLEDELAKHAGGINQKDLCSTVNTLHGVGEQRLRGVLKRYVGEKWNRGKGENNAWVYTPISPWPDEVEVAA